MSIKDTSTSKLIFIRSDDRQDVDNSLSTDFRVDLGSGSSLHEVRRIVLRSAHFINGSYNVNQYNNVLNWTYNSVSLSVVIPSGFYNITQLIAVIIPLMDTAQIPHGGATTAITQDAITKLLTITWSADTGFIETGGTFSINKTLGFQTDATPAISIVSDSPPKLQGLTHAFLRSQALSGGNNVDSQQELDNIFLNIPISAPYRVSNHYELGDDEWVP